MWFLKMAYREGRGSKKQLTFFLSCIVLGVAALVSVNSFSSNLGDAIDEQAKSLLGADLVFESRMPFNDRINELADSIGGRQSREYRFGSMALFPEAGETRMVRVRATDNNFPFYGNLETDPGSAADDYQPSGGALVADNLKYRFQLAQGDTIRLGNAGFPVSGIILNIPGETITTGLIGPTVFIPLSRVYETGLLDRGSHVSYLIYFAFDDGTDAEKLLTEIEPELVRNRVQSDTVEQRKAGLGDTFGNLTTFLKLVGFIALLLGGTGVGSSVYVFIRSRLTSIAMLHCLGAAKRQTFSIYLCLVFLMGLAGALLGCLLGVGIQLYLPVILADFLPVNVPFSLAPNAIFQGLIMGTVITLLFTLPPLLSIRNISPLNVLRSEYETPSKRQTDIVKWTAYFSIAAGIILLSISQTQSVYTGMIFSAGVIAVFILLGLCAGLLMWLLKRFIPGSLPYEWRQGLSNIYRPHNQTLVMMLAAGLGAFLISTLYLTQNLLLRQVELSLGEHQANMVLFDIQDDQLEEISSLVRSFGLPVIQRVPIVTMRIEEIEGQSLEYIRANKLRNIPDWIYAREMRSTYRDTLSPGERLISGTRPEYFTGTGPIPITMEQGVAETMNIEVGDEVVFNVQGIPFNTVIAGLRKVNWQQVQPNFIFVFPAGVLEEAPKFHVLVTRSSDRQTTSEVQSAVVQSYPNISVIDLDLILATVDEVLSRISYVIRFMAVFSIITGLIVLTGAIMTGRFQRIREGLLLKTLGASRRQVWKIITIEYLTLGIMASLTGLLLSVAASWTLAEYVFNVMFLPAVLPLVITFLSVTLIIMLIGLLNSRGIYHKPVLEVMRE